MVGLGMADGSVEQCVAPCRTRAVTVLAFGLNGNGPGWAVRNDALWDHPARGTLRRGGRRNLARQTHNALESLLLFLLIAVSSLAQAPSEGSGVEISSPTSGATVGGVVSIVGSVTVDGLIHYELALGPGAEPQQWLPIGERVEEQVASGTLVIWNTTRIPDGVYILRLRAVRADTYVDVFVGPIFVGNVPRTAVPQPTMEPTETPTPTPLESPTPIPSRELSDGVSPFLRIVVTPQSDPLCVGQQQRYSIWLSNVGTEPLTRVRVTDILPESCVPVLAQSTEGTLLDEGRSVLWEVASIAPGAAVQIELQVEVPSWLIAGTWLQNELRVSSYQFPYVGKTVRTLLSECTQLRATAAARPIVMPTLVPRSKRTPTPTHSSVPMGKPTLRPTPTTFTFSIREETVALGLDIFTLVVAGGLAILAVITMVLIYRRLAKKR